MLMESSVLLLCGYLLRSVDKLKNREMIDRQSGGKGLVRVRIMMKKSYRLLILFHLISVLNVWAGDTLRIDFQKEMDNMVENSGQSGWGEEMTEQLELWRLSPLNLNMATKSDLEIFPFLSEKQIEEILAYRYIYGDFTTIYELMSVPHMSRRATALLLPFVRVAPVDREKFPSLKTIFKYGRHECMTRLDLPFYRREGYRNKFYGTRQYSSFRYKFRYSDYVEWGISGEKDAGEPFGSMKNRYGYDFYSFSLFIRNLRRMKTLALGDYRLNFGEGLVVKNSFQLSPSYQISSYNPGGIRRSGYTDEINFFRGAAVTVEPRPDWELSTFYSHRRIDGRLRNDTLLTMPLTGLHRTKNELENKHTAVMQMTGGNIQFDNHRLHLGVTGILYGLNHPYYPSLKDYKKYHICGSRFYNVGVNYGYKSPSLQISGETAVGKKGFALLHKLLCSPSFHWNILLLHRCFSKDYQALYARSFSETSGVQNEQGLYAAAEYAPSYRWRLFGSFDYFKFPFMRYRISRPSSGLSAKFQLSYRPSQSVNIHVNYAYKKKDRDFSLGKSRLTGVTHKHRLRCKLDIEQSDWLFRTSADCTRFSSLDKGGRSGFGLLQMAAYRSERFPLDFAVQSACFHTEDYDTRIYMYERGLMYSFYIPSFTGKGMRCSLLLNCRSGDRLLLQMKYGLTAYFDRDFISSGANKIDSRRKSDLQLQLRYRF